MVPTSKSAAKTDSDGKAPAAVPAPDPRESTPVARFSTKREVRTVEIDEKFYPLRSLADYGIGAQQRLNRDGREFGQLWNSEEDLTEDQGKRLKFLLDRIFDGDALVAPLVDAPKSVRAKLGDDARSELVLDFCYAPLRKMMIAAAQQEMEVETAEEPRDSESIPTS